MMKKMKISAVVAILAACACSAQAQLDGSTVNVSTYYPTSSSLWEAGPNVVVTGSTEYPTGSFPAYNAAFSVDVTDNQLIIINPDGTGYDSGSFNGFVLTIVSGPTITSATVDGSSAYAPVSLSVVGGDQIFVNNAGISAPGGEEIIDINTGSSSVPDGGLTIAMLGSAMTVLAFIRRKF